MDYLLCGPATVSREGWRLVLRAYGAPAGVQSAAGQLYDMCLTAGVDANYALAQARSEHSLQWAGVAGTTKGWGNLRATADWTGRTYQGFRAYDTYADGLADYLRLIRAYYYDRGLRTVSAALPVYAPSSENDTAAVIDSINRACAAWQATYGGGLMEITAARFRARNISAEPVNVRTGPGVGYERVGSVAPGVAYDCSGYTTEGVAWTYNGTTSSVWLRRTDGNWVTGHGTYSAYTLPPSIEELQAQLASTRSSLNGAQQELATCKTRLDGLQAAYAETTDSLAAARAEHDALISKARALTIAAALGVG